MKLWGGRFQDDTDSLVEAYTASISFDKRLAKYDIRGSIAHASMLGACGIVTPEEMRALIGGLEALLEAYHRGELTFSVRDEDIHMNIERMLTERIGPVAGKLHSARSRNDQVALDMHLYVRDAVRDVLTGIHQLQESLVHAAQKYFGVIIPGYTHLQRAQPVLLSHHLLAYFWMLDRDYQRFLDLQERVDMMPLGAGALAGTTFPIDREHVQDALGFSCLYENSLDAVSDRDYLLEFLSGASIVMMHLSRFSEELILWSSEEFGFVELGDAYCTGSSMMPQKKNPDVPELVRGKSGRVFGHLLGLLTVMKGLPLAYNKDLQEDKEGVFDTLDTLLPALTLFAGMVDTFKVKEQRLEQAFARDFSNATDVADYLAAKGLPFREAHAVIGKLVLRAIEQGVNLASLPFEVYEAASPYFEQDVYEILNINHVVAARTVRGGTGHGAVKEQLERADARLKARQIDVE